MKNILLIFPSKDECWGRVVDYCDIDGVLWVKVEYELYGEKNSATSLIWINWTDKVGYDNNIILNRVYEIEV